MPRPSHMRKKEAINVNICFFQFVPQKAPNNKSLHKKKHLPLAITKPYKSTPVMPYAFGLMIKFTSYATNG